MTHSQSNQLASLLIMSMLNNAELIWRIKENKNFIYLFSQFKIPQYNVTHINLDINEYSLEFINTLKKDVLTNKNNMKRYFGNITFLKYPLLFETEQKNVELFRRLCIIFPKLNKIELIDSIDYGIDTVVK